MSSAVIDTALGLGLTFFLVALLASAAVETIANLVRKRAKYLLRGLRDMLDTPPASRRPEAGRAGSARADVQAEKALYRTSLTAGTDGGKVVPRPVAAAADLPGWTVALMGHPLVRPFKSSRTAGGQVRNPSYLPARSFAAALVDMIVPDSGGSTSLAAIRKAVVNLPLAVPFRGALLSMLNTAGQDVGVFMASLERWYDDQMDRIGGSYKRWAKRWAIVIALTFAVVFQVDAIAVGTRLFVDEPLRQTVAAAAAVAAGEQQVCEPKPGEQFGTTRDCVTAALGGLPVGWAAGELPWSVGHHAHAWTWWATKALGWIITGIAASLGAPFWFDALGKLGSLRNTGQKPAPAGG